MPIPCLNDQLSKDVCSGLFYWHRQVKPPDCFEIFVKQPRFVFVGVTFSKSLRYFVPPE